MRRPAQRGFILMGVIVACIVVGIVSGTAVQEWSIIEQREREAQLIFIQEQFAAAILAYQKDKGALPANLEQLLEPGQAGQRFLRRKYVDPMVRGATFEDWCVLKMGAAARVVSSCAPASEGGEGAGGLDGDGTGAGAGGFGGGFGGGLDGGSGEAGAGTATASGGATTGDRTAMRDAAGVGSRGTAAGRPGTSTAGGIVGVHSKSKEQAYNAVRRTEPTYDRWYYTIEDFGKEQAARAIPGVPKAPTSDGGAGTAPTMPGGLGSGTTTPGSGLGTTTPAGGR